MSNKVIHDLVLPLIIKEMEKRGVGVPTYVAIHDEQLEHYFVEALSKALGVTGKFNRSVNCPDLERRIKEAQKRDPEGYEKLIGILLEKYINLRAQLEIAEKTKTKKKKKKIYTGPPDRFQKQREKAKEVFG